MLKHNQRSFEQGLFEIIDNHLRENGQNPDAMSEQERNKVYLYYIGKTIDEIKRGEKEGVSI